MPNAKEIATIEVNDKKYEDWKTIWVHCEFPGTFRTFRLSVSEKNPAGKLKAAQIKPGDFCKVSLGGELAVTGYVYERQTSYDAHNHGVLIAGQGKPGDLTRSSIEQKGGQFRGWTIKQIAETLVKNYGVNVLIKGNTEFMMTPFEDVQVMPGESCFAMLDRLGRPRGVYIGDNAEGDLILHGGTKGGGDSGPVLREGENIQTARVTINDLNIISKGIVIGQAWAVDEDWGRPIAQPTITIDNPEFKRYKPYKFLAERALSPKYKMKELKARGTFEMAWRKGTEIIAEINVQGWMKPGGGLWDGGPDARVYLDAPMAMVKETMAIRKLTFTQDNERGTMTTLELINPDFYNGMGIQLD